MTGAPEDLLARLELSLRAPLPGIPAQLAMAPEPRSGQRAYFEVEDSCRKAGVLVLLYVRDGRLRLPLTRRTESVDHHRGQISLPGGARQRGESMEAAALRETREELGLDLGRVRVLGRLTPLYIPPSNYCIYPTVACLPGPLEFRPQPDEVAEVIEAPVDRLADPAIIGRETWRYGGLDHVVPFYELDGHKIWGATAMVLAEFLALLLQ
ncbi:MAG TPA: CoA pyrophosphatase [Candidatus Aminicenantes bacterium]|nr:CoA pyrophosphatase [Candidatus Aminicenantes bacterium]HRY64647.1 CoA pyrophosphatase [Candidatus Aminicenantes bacterium]HRZ71560.1 CoA pyrophosphatase [Candidatus Aminicenantes bacterium]